MQLRERIAAEWATPEVRFAAAWSVLVYAWSCLAAPDGYLLSFDDIWRLVHAHEASRGALTPSDVWPPLPFWVVGLFLRLGFSSTFAPQVIGILISAATLVQFWRLAEELGLAGAGRVATVLTLAVLPGWLWLAPSALVETWTLLALLIALRAVRSWWVDGRSDLLIHAFGALGVAGVIRYEAWGWALGLVMVVRLAADQGRAVGNWQRGAAVVATFPAVWCAYQFAATGSPFTFGSFALEFLAEDHPDAGPLARLAVGTEALSELVAPIWLAGALGWTLGTRLRGGMVVLIAVLVLTVMQLVAHGLGFAGLHNVWRHYLPLAVGFALGVGMLIDRVSRLGAGVSWAALALVVQVEFLHYAWPDSGYSDAVGRVAHHVRRLHRELGGNILIEGVGYDSRVLQILTGDMDAAVFDRLIWLVPLDRPMTDAERAQNRSILERPYADVEASIRRDNVRVIAVFTDSAYKAARAFGSVEYTAGTVKEGRWIVLRSTLAAAPSE